MTRRLLFALVFLLVISGALLLRIPRLADRPMHNDEGVNTIKFNELWTTGHFQYDPTEFHGPTLYYLTLPAVWLSGAIDYSTTNEWTYRIVPVAVGTWLLAMPMLLRRPLGSWAAIWAALLGAASPSMVYFSRYYIHEFVLVFFTFGAIITGWRFSLRGRWRWAIGAGICMGMMAATKETWIIHAGAAAVAIGMVWLWDKIRGEGGTAGVHVKPMRMLAGAGVAAIAFAGIVIFMYSNFFQNLRDVSKFWEAYAIYFHRGSGGEGAHNHPFNYYLKILTWFQAFKNAPIFTELLTVALAAIGLILAMAIHARPAKLKLAHVVVTHEPHEHLPKRAPGHHPLAYARLLGRFRFQEHATPLPSIPFVRFMAFYTVVLTIAYSMVSYKTPWCMLSFLHGMTIVGGFAIARLVKWTPTYIGKGLVSAAILAGVGQLAWQANRASGISAIAAKQGISSREFNPYVYSHTTANIFEFGRKMDEIAAVSPDGYRTHVQVIGHDIWPLPFYLRRFQTIGFWPDLPKTPGAVIIGTGELAERLREPEWRRESVAALRPRERILSIYFREELGQRLDALRQGLPLPPATRPATRPTIDPITPTPTGTPGTPTPK